MGLERQEFEDDALERARLDRAHDQRKPVPGAPWFDKLADVGVTDDDDQALKEK